MEKRMSNDEIMDYLKLRPAQKRVLPLLMMGLSNEDIAEELYLAEKSVKYQVTLIYKQVGLDSRARLLAGLFKLGWRADNTIKLPVVAPVYKAIPTLQAGISKWT